jgi:prefoldin alpha subunit
VVNKVETVDPRELQALQHYLNEYGQQLEIFSGQLDILEHGRVETIAAIESLQSMASAEDGIVLLQVGGGASVRAKVVEPDKVLLNIGAEVIVERPVAEAVEFLKDRITEMGASQKRLVEMIEKIRSQMNELGKRLEQGYAQVQAQSQGMRPVPSTPKGKAGEE